MPPLLTWVVGFKDHHVSALRTVFSSLQLPMFTTLRSKTDADSKGASPRTHSWPRLLFGASRMAAAYQVVFHASLPGAPPCADGGLEQMPTMPPESTTVSE